MRRFRFSVLGLCISLGACGEKFVAHTGSDDGGGSSDRGSAGALSGTGGAAEGGGRGMDDSAGAAGDADAGEAGSNPGGGGGSANGGAGGLRSSLGGSSGSAGSGGKLNDPSLPADGLLVWLRADSGVHDNTDGLVQRWDDQSGNQLNATQPTLKARPVYLPTGFNGRPTLEFDGQGQFLAFAAGFGDFSKGFAGLIVAKPTKSYCASMVELSNGTEIDDIALAMAEDKWTYEVESAFLQTGEVEHSAFSLYAANHLTSGTGELRINGSALQTLPMPLPALPASGVRANNFVGHTLYASNCEYFKGQISEIILYSRALDSLELIAIEKYLDKRWSVITPVPTP